MHSNQFLRELEAYAADQRRLIETEVSGFSVDPEASRQRKDRVDGGDFEYFCREYFPHYIKSEPSVFHRYVFDDLVPRLDQERGFNEAIEAPRGEAKSTLITQILHIYEIVTGREWFTVIGMDVFDQAAMMLEGIKAELETNPRLLQDFPEATGIGRVWQVGVIVTRNNRKVQVAGVGKKVRGWRHGPHRPGLVTLDDLENDENVVKVEQRNKLQRWLTRAVMKMGPPDGSMKIIYVGTELHHDSVLSRTMRSPTWRSRRFQAIIKWPDRMDIWDQWEEVLINQGEEAADKFYSRRRELMNKGAVVSWPSTRPLELLMKIRADDHHAFDSEFQNDPSNDEQAPFKDITFWVHESDRWTFYGSCDPSLGRKNKARDPQATLVGGWDKKKGRLDVIVADISRKVPDLIIAGIIELQREYQCILWAVEAVQFQEFMVTELLKRSVKLEFRCRLCRWYRIPIRISGSSRFSRTLLMDKFVFTEVRRCCTSR